MFSEKILKMDKFLQKDDMDQKLRNDIWNTFQKFFLDEIYYMDKISGPDTYSGEVLGDCINHDYAIDLFENFFILPLDDIKEELLYNIKYKISKQYKSLKWYEVYDLIEFLIKRLKSRAFIKEINFKLERNNSAYRIVEKELLPITNNKEIEVIETASKTQFDLVNVHINKAKQLFGDRIHPDYENTIKESITAVETMCSIIVGKSSTLGDALNILEKNGVIIHPALKEAFKKLYGYTSDGKGIRHAGDIGGKESTFSEAKFMMVSCSAFVNYLIENYSKIR